MSLPSGLWTCKKGSRYGSRPVCQLTVWPPRAMVPSFGLIAVRRPSANGTTTAASSLPSGVKVRTSGPVNFTLPSAVSVTSGALLGAVM